MINKSKINIIAHAGCMNTSMDSIDSIEMGIKYGAEIIEIDLNIDNEGYPVLAHDKPKGNREYIKFEKVLDIIKNNKDTLLNIDVKDMSVLKLLSDIILKYKLSNRVFLTGLTYNDIISNKEFLLDIYYFINIEGSDIKNYEYKKLINELETVKFLGININYKFVDLEILSFCRERKSLISVWVVDDIYNMEKLILQRVNFITTNKVDSLKNKIVEMKYLLKQC